ncbi:MAG: methionine adenosyltransferase domain-containing protein, partial [Candidatus Binataceae bacterium]
VYERGKPVRAASIVLSTQHRDGLSPADVADIVRPFILAVLPQSFVTDETQWHINPTGIFVIGGPDGDCGLTGRKIIVDSYGGYGRHGGGAFSGKDPTKVDRSACYMARYVAKNVVAAGLAKRCEIQVAYAIGVAEPVSLLIDTFDTGTVPDHKLSSALRESFDFRPAAIMKTLNLRRPIYQATAAYGHFGRAAANGFFPWERVDRVDALRSAFGLQSR